MKLSDYGLLFEILLRCLLNSRETRLLVLFFSGEISDDKTGK